MTDCTASPELCLGLNCFGYGNWAAPYWFIGLEEGLGKDEDGNLLRRHNAFHCHQQDGLSDCRDFHFGIGERRLHEPKVKTVPTWRGLIRLLLAFKRESTSLDEIRSSTSLDEIRSYQQMQWGRSESETCVAELWGCAAKKFQPKKNSDLARERANTILGKMKEPEFVVIYGAAQRSYWEENFPSDKAIEKYKRNEELHVFGQTVVAFTLHPATKGLENQHWLDWGNRLRTEVAKARSRTA